MADERAIAGAIWRVMMPGETYKAASEDGKACVAAAREVIKLLPMSATAREIAVERDAARAEVVHAKEATLRAEALVHDLEVRHERDSTLLAALTARLNEAQAPRPAEIRRVDNVRWLIPRGVRFDQQSSAEYALPGEPGSRPQLLDLIQAEEAAARGTEVLTRLVTPWRSAF